MAGLTTRVRDAAEAALQESSFVDPLDVLCRIGWLAPVNAERWRQGRMPTPLGSLLPVGPERVARVLDVLRGWATARGLTASEAANVSATRDRTPLRFHDGADEGLERAIRTHWLAPDLSDHRREHLVENQNRLPELLVISPVKDWTCTGCGGTGDLLTMDDARPVCLTCADLDALVFLPSGDGTLTRRARRESGLSAVVVRWSRPRKRYVRQGILVEETALERAEASCLADAEVRRRQRERGRERREREDVELVRLMAAELRRLFPGCPVDRAAAIAAHTAVRGSGRVGRSAAGRSLDERALAAAVVASVRHEDTGYDGLLMAGVPREEARERVRDEVDAVLDAWREERHDC